MRALRAQISPHFVYNALTTIASFVRTDPERARELLLEFADFTRYSFRAAGEFTTLADELRNIERYLALEQARFGDRLAGHAADRAGGAAGGGARSWRCSRWWRTPCGTGWRASPGGGTSRSCAEDPAASALISVEDDGVGDGPRAGTAGAGRRRRRRLGRAGQRRRPAALAFGDDYGLVVETAPGAGTKVSVRVPKFAPGVHARSNIPELRESDRPVSIGQVAALSAIAGRSCPGGRASRTLHTLHRCA